MKLSIDGIDFWDRTTSGGPLAWELRSSVDGFADPLIGGATNVYPATGAGSNDFGHQITARFNKPLESLRTSAFPITFLVYALCQATPNDALITSRCSATRSHFRKPTTTPMAFRWPSRMQRQTTATATTTTFPTAISPTTFLISSTLKEYVTLVSPFGTVLVDVQISENNPADQST